jgi:hypothetical protein
MAVKHLAGNRIQGSNAERISTASAPTIITSVSGYTILKFTGSGTFTPSGSFNVDYLVQAGGGGGGNGISSSSGRAGGGGGAGGYRVNSSAYGVTAQSYTVTVGAGGAGGDNSGSGIAVQGGDSVFGSITSSGGGYGSSTGSGGQAAAAGGSGGGDAGQNSVASGNTPSTTPPPPANPCAGLVLGVFPAATEF